MSDVTDPVCKMEFPEESAEELGASRTVHRGRTYWFCSPTCLHEFEAEPSRFVRSSDHKDDDAAEEI